MQCWGSVIWGDENQVIKSRPSWGRGSIPSVVCTAVQAHLAAQHDHGRTPHRLEGTLGRGISWASPCHLLGQIELCGVSGCMWEGSEGVGASVSWGWTWEHERGRGQGVGRSVWVKLWGDHSAERVGGASERSCHGSGGIEGQGLESGQVKPPGHWGKGLGMEPVLEAWGQCVAGRQG